MTDVTAPLLLSSTPTDGGGLAGMTSTISLTFNEDVQAGSGKIRLRSSSYGGNALSTYDVSTSAVRFSGSTVSVDVTLNFTLGSDPSAPLANLYLEVESGAISDLSGNPFAGISNQTDLNFSAPILLGRMQGTSSPGDNAISVDPAISMVVSFWGYKLTSGPSAYVAQNGGLIEIKRVRDDVAVASIAATDTSQISYYGGSGIVINPAADLDYSTDYYLNVSAGAFSGLGGVLTEGLTGSTQYNFRTAVGVVSATPADNAGSVARDANIVLTFSETVTPAANAAVVLRRGDNTVAGSFALADTSQVTVNGSTVTINPLFDLDPSTTYYLQIASGAVSGANANQFAGITSSTALNFKTDAALVASTPADNAGAIDPAQNLTLTFSESMQAGTGVITLHHYDTGAVAGSFSVTGPEVSIVGSTVTIDPAADLDFNSHYYLQIGSGVLQSSAGNVFNGISGSNRLDFTTTDTLAPTLTGRAPADGAIDVAVDANLVLAFNEPVRAGTGVIYLMRSDTQTVAGSFAVTDSTVVFSGSSVTIDLPADLGYGTHYYVEMAAGVILDTAGNNFAGLTGSGAYDFTTVPPPPPPPQSPPVSPPASPPPVTQTVDGVTVQQQTTTNSDGSTTRTTTIPVVTGTRQEQTGNNSVADIPLVTSGSTTLLAAQVPTGVGLTVSGGTTAKTAGTSVTDLIREIEARTTAGSADRTDLTGGGTGFLGALPGDTPLIVQTLVPTVAGGSTAAPTEPLVISAPPPAAGQAQTALVIDTRNLPSGTIVQLQNVSFAAVIGAVQVTGGDGSQSVFGDGFAQYIVLGADDDTLHGGDGADTVGSKTGDDVIYGDGGDDNVFGGDDADRVFGGVGADTVQGNKGADFVQGNQGDDTVWAGQGNDTARGGRDADQVHGDLGDDVVYGDYGSDQVYGNAGNDTLWGGDGNDIALDTADTLFGGQGNDIVYAQYGADSVSGDLGDDYVEGNRANDSLSGGDGADTLRGGRDDDLLQGGAGNDELWGDLGDDTLTGGAGADVFVFRSGDGADTVTDFSLGDGDRIRLASGMTWTVAAGSGGAVVSLSGGGTVTLSGVAAGDVTAVLFTTV